MTKLPRHGHWIGGQSVAPASGEYLTSDNPFTGQDWYEFARGNAADVNLAVEAAIPAQADWSRFSASKRGRILVQVADLPEKEAHVLAELESRDNGKLFAEMTTLGLGMAAWFRYYGGMADKVEGTNIPPEDPSKFLFTRWEPIGVVGMITPWNSPLYLLVNKLAPALAGGNAAVIKPSEYVSLASVEFVKLCERAGVPAGLINVVTGLGIEAGQPLVAHPKVPKICFTGSDYGGQAIYEGAAKELKQVQLELGGKSPNIVFEDANFEAAVMGAVSGIFAAAGQTCIAGSRLLVQHSIHDAFVARLKEVAEGARLGDPMDPETNMGPIATKPQLEKIKSYVAIARGEGATVVCGGTPAEVPGSANRFFPPTILTGINNTMRIAREEVFGPVVSVIPFEDEAEAIAIANDTNYGLAAGIWTSDMGRAIRVSGAVQAGTVWVNTYRAGSHTAPFGGYKRSGIGREGGIDAIKSFMQQKSVIMSTDLSVANPFIARKG
jgi:acyl-CoA reductase-like NAD-dependent aldehyde dehydrogenase